MSDTTLESRMLDEDLWGIDDIAEVLSLCNEQNKEYFKALIEKAMQSNNLNTVPKLWSMSDHKDRGPQFKPENVIEWLKKKRFNLPQELLNEGVPLAESKKAIGSLLKLVITMALEKYDYDPEASKSSVPNTLAKDVQKRTGESIDPDTVRGWLKKGTERFINS